jgi:predicted PurR-regulated permease PerM
VARDGRAPESWPEALRREPAPEAPTVWSAAWPGATRAEVEEAYSRLPQGTNARWLRNLASAGQALAAKHTGLLTARRAVSNAQAVGEPEAERVRQALATKLGDDDLRLTKALGAQLDDEAAAGNPAARELLAELRGDAGDGGGNWLAPMLASLEASIQGELKALPVRLGNWAKSAISFSDLFNLGLDTLLVPIYAFFLILGMAQIRRRVREHLPLWKRDQVLRIIHDIELVVAAFFRGRLLVCLFCAVLTYIGFTIIGLLGTAVPYAALFAVLIGLATAIPFAGILFLVPAVLLTLLEGGSGGTVWALVGVYAAVQGLETFLLTPTIMGRETELHPVTLIIALLLCGKLIGILGVILAVPIAATCRILAREFLWPRVRQWAGHGGASDRLDARPPAAP